MTVIQPSLFYVIKRFPGRKDAINRLFRENKNFHTICEDYKLCAEALKRWNQSTADEAETYRREYAELISDLESEIRAYLGEI